MRLAIYSTRQDPTHRIGIVVDDHVMDAGFTGSMIELITDWDRHKESIRAVAQTKSGVPLASVSLHEPVERPGKIWAIGLNYADHIEESKMDTPTRQVWFTKAQTSLNGPNDPILIPKDGDYVDYEAELVAVIGKRGKYIKAEEAADYVFGYCVGNDVTERFWQHAGPQWSLGKSFDTHGPIGPWITSADEVVDPHRLDIVCSVNGEVRQQSNTEHLVFDIWQQIEHLSAAMTLEPGDLIFTGTPGGIGAAMNPRQFLKAGDKVRCEIARLGAIEAEMVKEG